jgi:hypothetical protein
MPPLKPPEPPGQEDDRPAWERRVTSVEINGRRVNEAIERGLRAGDDHATFVCECGRIGCAEKLELGLAEYELVREEFNRFLLVPGHEISGVDDVIERADGYFVAEKRGEESLEMVQRTDPRS